MTEGTADHVFVVGLSRSGTTLVRHILNSHSQLAIAPESHYLGHQFPGAGVRAVLRRRFPDRTTPDAASALVNFLYDGGLERATRWRTPSRLWLWVKRRLPADDLRNRFALSDRSERALFSAILAAYAEVKGKPIAGEKTPAHLYHVDTLLSWFPNGRVLHMMRDPRAIFVSDLRRRRRSPGALPYQVLARVPGALDLLLLVQVTVSWRRAAGRARANQARYPDRFRVIRFEDLVADPERTVRAMAGFVGVDYEASMLDQQVVSAGARSGDAGFDRGAAQRWRERIQPWANAWFRATLGSDLRRLGYR
jgi:hypothetical protein